MDNIIGYLLSVVTLALMSPAHSPQSAASPRNHAHQLLGALLHWLASGEWEGLTTPLTRQNALSDLASLSPSLLAGGGLWKPLLKLLCQLDSSHGNSIIR